MKEKIAFPLEAMFEQGTQDIAGLQEDIKVALNPGVRFYSGLVAGRGMESNLSRYSPGLTLTTQW